MQYDHVIIQRLYTAFEVSQCDNVPHHQFDHDGQCHVIVRVQHTHEGLHLLPLGFGSSSWQEHQSQRSRPGLLVGHLENNFFPIHMRVTSMANRYSSQNLL